MEIVRPDPKNKLGQRVLFDPKDMSECLLAGIYYDGEINKAFLKLYEPVSQQLFRWTDNTNHLSYCLVKDLEEEKIVDAIGERALKMERVFRYEALTDQVIPMTKITCATPTDIGGRDSSIRNCIKAWEADIRYTDTYCMDTRLEPGMFYRIEGGKLIPTIGARAVPRQLHEDEDRLQNLMERWVRLTEAPVPEFRRAAVDIETNSPDEHHMYDPAESEVQITACSIATSDGRREVLTLRRPQVGLGEEINGEVEVIGPEITKDGKSLSGEVSKVNVRMFDSEQALIAEIFKVLWEYPFILTYNGDNYDFRFLYNRAIRLDFQPYQIPIEFHRNLMGLKYGIHIDLMRLFANQSLCTYAFGGKYKINGGTVGLNEVGEGLIGEGKIQHEGVEIDMMDYHTLTTYSFQDAKLTLKLTTYSNNLVMRLMTVLSRLSYQSYEDLSREGASGWIRSLMFREHRIRNFLIPRREPHREGEPPKGDIMDVKGFTETKSVIAGKGFKGAFVEDPKFGIHFGVTVLDFASLYPSIYKTWNLGYDTVRCPHEDCRTIDPRIVPETTHWVCKKNYAMQSDIIGTLRDLRVKYYKKKGKNPHYPNEKHVEGNCDCGGAIDEASTEDRKTYYGTVEQTLKVFLNAYYGVMAAEHFAFYCPPVAESITAIARSSIGKVISKAKELGLIVLYGDTDSVFIEEAK
jgi:DNA polymerase, archaea type